MTTKVQRVDRFAFRLDGPKARWVEGGMLEAWGVATRVGIFEYRTPDGEPFMELRPAEEVLKPESLSSLRGVPFTIDHPDEDVTRHNAQALTHGWVIEVKPDPETGLVWVLIRISTDEALRTIDTGKVELSCGYMATLEHVSGSTDEGAYDAIQRDIRYNHLALVDAARAGPQARLKLDAAAVHRHDAQEQPMKFKIRHDGKSHEAPRSIVLGLRAEAKETRADLIETAKVTIEGPDGPEELVLPMATVEQIIAMLGGEAPAPAEPAPMPEDMEPPMEEPLDMEEEQLDEEGEEKMDAKKVQSMIDAAVAKAVGRALTKAKADAAAEASEFADVVSKARVVLGDSYDASGKTCWQVAGEAIKAAGGDRSDLVARASKKDERARGMLLQALATAVTSHKDSKGKDPSNEVIRLVQPEGEKKDAAEAYDPRKAMIERQRAGISRAKGKAQG